MSDESEPLAGRTLPSYETGEQVGAGVRRISLLVFYGETAELIPIPPGTAVVIGRESPADFVVPDRSLSRRHAKFEWKDGQQQLTLRESGTYEIQVRASDLVSTGTYSLGLECLPPPG